MAGLKEGRVVCALVTFTDESWACPDTHIEFDLSRAKQKVRNALGGLSFVAAFEAAYYVNEKWEKAGKEGNLVSFHCHAVVWATHYSQLSRCRKRIKPRFRPILGNNGVRFDALKKKRGRLQGSSLPSENARPRLPDRASGVGQENPSIGQALVPVTLSSVHGSSTIRPARFLAGRWRGAKILREARTNLNAHGERRRGRGNESHVPCSSRVRIADGPRLRAF
jgi:hypothetical protein